MQFLRFSVLPGSAESQVNLCGIDSKVSFDLRFELLYKPAHNPLHVCSLDALYTTFFIVSLLLCHCTICSVAF